MSLERVDTPSTRKREREMVDSTPEAYTDDVAGCEYDSLARDLVHPFSPWTPEPVRDRRPGTVSGMSGRPIRQVYGGNCAGLSEYFGHEAVAAYPPTAQGAPGGKWRAHPAGGSTLQPVEAFGCGEPGGWGHFLPVGEVDFFRGWKLGLFVGMWGNPPKRA